MDRPDTCTQRLQIHAKALLQDSGQQAGTVLIRTGATPFR